MLNKIPGWIQFSALLLVGVLLLWLAFRGQDLREIMAHLATARWGWIGLSLVLTLLGHLSRARRWQLLIQAAGHRAGLMDCFVTMMAGYLTNLGIPRLGEVSRCASLYRLTGTPILALGGTVFAERAVDLATLGMLLVATLVMAGDQASGFFFQELMEPLFAVLNWKLVVVICLGIVALVVVNAVAFRGKGTADGRGNKLQHWAEEIWNGLLSALKMRGWKLAEFGVHTAVIWLSYYSAPLCTLLALGVETNDVIGLAFYVFVFGSLSRTIPLPAGSAGAYHFIVSAWMMYLGYTQVLGLSVATLNHAVQTLFYLVFGALGLLGFFVLLRSRSAAQSQPISNSTNPNP